MAVTLAREVMNITTILKAEANVLNLEIPEEERVLDVTRKIRRATRKLRKKNIKLVRKEKGLKKNLKIAKKFTKEAIANLKLELKLEKRIHFSEEEAEKIVAKQKEHEEKSLHYTKKLLKLIEKQQEKLDGIRESFGDREKCMGLIKEIREIQVEKKDLWAEKHSNEQRIIIEAEKLKRFQRYIKRLKKRERPVIKAEEEELRREETAEEKGEIREAA
jgi:hypothetical protein